MVLGHAKTDHYRLYNEPKKQNFAGVERGYVKPLWVDKKKTNEKKIEKTRRKD